jgi:prophage DNA circulation protein
MRDWTATLWPASFKGVPFWVERDHADTGRRVSTTSFPGSDDPFNEDLGRKARYIEITGYFIGDVSDVEMTALEAACDTGSGPGVLVMPAQGPIAARCETIKRDRMRDKMGRFGFEAKFVREGLASPLQPQEFLAQLAFDAVDALAAAAPAFLNGVGL